MKMVVWVTSQFDAFHRWKNAPERAAFLRNYHRHIFEVELGVRVTDEERQVEFFELKGDLESVCSRYRGEQMDKSCETIAREIIDELKECYDIVYAVVSEDGENGVRIDVE